MIVCFGKQLCKRFIKAERHPRTEPWDEKNAHPPVGAVREPPLRGVSVVSNFSTSLKGMGTARRAHVPCFSRPEFLSFVETTGFRTNCLRSQVGYALRTDFNPRPHLVRIAHPTFTSSKQELPSKGTARRAPTLFSELQDTPGIFT